MTLHPAESLALRLGLKWSVYSGLGNKGGDARCAVVGTYQGRHIDQWWDAATSTAAADKALAAMKELQETKR